MAELDHIRWLGGSTGAGKTTIAKLLAHRASVSIYSTDATIATHDARLSSTTAPLLDRFRQMTMDERWVARDPDEMYRTFPWFHGEGFELLVDDLRVLPTDGITVVEGFRLLPDLVRPLLPDPAFGVWLLSAPSFREAAFATRRDADAFWLRTSDPHRALANLLARDDLFAAELAAAAEHNDVETLVVDGSRTANEVADTVAARFGL